MGTIGWLGAAGETMPSTGMPGASGCGCVGSRIEMEKRLAPLVKPVTPMYQISKVEPALLLAMSITCASGGALVDAY